MISRYNYCYNYFRSYLPQLYSRLNHLNICTSYSCTLHLINKLSKKYQVPLQVWIKNGHVVKFWGDNVDKKQRVRDHRSDRQDKMLHAFSIMVGRCRTPAPELSEQTGAQRHVMCGDTPRERLELLEPVSEDWHALVCLLKVSTK